MRGLTASMVAIAALALGAGPAMAATDGPAAPVSTGHSGWTWGSPTPQGVYLSDVTFDGATGYAVGGYGTALRSADGGQSWTGLPSGTTENLTHVQELSPTTVVVGGGCSASESTNGGTSFQQLPLGLQPECQTPVVGLSFSDARHGYVALQDGTVLYTDDGGQTVQAKTSAPGGDAGVYGIAFNSPSSGLSVSASGVIGRTIDGAGSWTEVHNAPRQLNSVRFVTATTAYAVGNQGELLRSDDGGASWRTLPLTISSGGPAPDLQNISCATADQCLIATSSSNRLVRTTDGGATGQIVSVSNQSLNAVAFTTGTTVVGVGAQGATVLSSDGGQTFPTVFSGGVPDTFSPTGALRAGGAAGTAYLGGEAGTIAATTDRGASWSLLRVPSGGAAIDDVAFPTRRIGFALGSDGTLRRTDDGGVRWRSFAAGHSSRSQLLAPTPNVQLLVGPRGVFRCTDGGADFHRVSGRVGSGPARGATVASLQLGHATAVGRRVVAWGPSGIVVSSDAGSHWRRVPAPEHGRIGSVSLVDGTRLWALVSGRLFATTDGGRRWRESVSIGHFGDPAKVSFASPDAGLLTLTNGPTDVTLLSTRDGGRTWEPQSIERTSDGYLLATKAADFYAGSYQSSANAGSQLGFWATHDGGASPRATRLRIALAHRRMTARALARAGHGVVLRGHLSPVLADRQPVLVSYTSGLGRWRTATAHVASSGAFRVRLTGIRTTTDIVAQSIGNGLYGGAGTPVLRLTIGR